MVNINDVYQRVLFIANKEQRGYITPDEFNSYATQAQLEIFEGYFIKQFQAMQAPMSESDYADISMNVEEKINEFYASITNPTISSSGIYEYPSDFYRLTHVSVGGRLCDEVMHNKISYVMLSPLTAPTITQPVMVRRANGVQIYPSNLGGQSVIMDYLRRPVNPKWGFIMAPNMEPVYDPTVTTDYTQDAGSVQFELHPSDEQDLVYKILTLAGVAIKQPDVSSFGQGKDSQLQQTEG